MIEVRTVQSSEEIAGVARLVSTHLQQERAAQVEQLLIHGLEEGSVLKPERCVICLDEGEIVATLQLLSLEVSIGEARFRAAGLAGIVAKPAYWGRDCVQHLVAHAQSLAEAPDVQLALGFGVAHFYERWGGVTILSDCEGRIEARRVRGESSAPFRVAGAEDTPHLLALYAEANRGRSGTFTRTEETWRYSFLRPPELRIREDAYYGFALEEKQLVLREVGARTLQGYRDVLFEACAEARNQGKRWVLAEVPFDGGLLRAAVPHGVKVELHYPSSGRWSGRMLRVADFFRRLEPELALRLARSGGPALRLNVRTGQESLCLELPGQGQTTELELTLSRGALLQLAFGYREPLDLLAEEGLELPAAGQEALELLFPRTHTHIWYANRF